MANGESTVARLLEGALPVGAPEFVLEALARLELPELVHWVHTASFAIRLKSNVP